MITWLGTTKLVASIGVWLQPHLLVAVQPLIHPPPPLLVQLMPDTQLGIKISTAMISSIHQNVIMMVVTAVSKKDRTGIIIAMNVHAKDGTAQLMDLHQLIGGVTGSVMMHSTLLDACMTEEIAVLHTHSTVGTIIAMIALAKILSSRPLQDSKLL